MTKDDCIKDRIVTVCFIYIFQKLPQADFVMVPDAGHSFQDGGNQSALIAATEKYKHL
jgi:hypothetical protein